MKQTARIRFYSTNCLPSYQILTGIFALVLVFSLFLNPSIPVSAGTSSQETQNTTFQSFLPITLASDPAFYVSTRGNDHNPGTFNSPWRTISKAAQMVEPGNVVYIRGGIYPESVDFSKSGYSFAPIQILAYPGEIPIIDGNNFNIPAEQGGALLEISGNYILVSGLEVRYSSYLGVVITGVHDVADRINAHHNLHGGMNLNGDYGVIKNSTVWSNDMQNYGGINPAGDSTGLTAARHPNFAILSNNVVFGNWGIGLSTYESNGTILEDNIVYDNFGPNVYISDATNVLFQDNFIYATGSMISGGQIGIQTGDEKSNPPSSNITIINNIVYGTTRNLYCLRGSTGKMSNVLIANNTFINSMDESGIELKAGSYENVNFINNLIQQDGPLPIIRVEDNHPGLTFSNNLWSKPPRDAASGPGDVIGDPLLMHTGGPFSPIWFMLTDVSPAIGEAVSLPQVNFDYFGNTREAIPDIGADEFFPTP